jgi:hypothetical protein
VFLPISCSPPRGIIFRADAVVFFAIMRILC